MKNLYTKVSTIKRILQSGITTKGIAALILVAASSMNAMAQSEPGKTTTEQINFKDSYEVKGTVYDEDGQPLPGASIVIKGTSMGVQTDKYGDFRIRMPQGHDILMISYIGMNYQQINVKGKTSIKVTMKSSAQQLKDVVVVAYGQQQKKDVVTAVTTIKADEIMQENQTNIGNALQGKVAGAVVVSNKGIPGRNRPTIMIRGIGDATKQPTPLIVIDGVPRYSDKPLTNGLELNGITLDDINPDQVESISVLKDNAATAIYGNRGAYGVILITTKRGKIGKPQFNFSTSYSMDEPARFPSVFDSYHWALTENEILKNDGAAARWRPGQLDTLRYGLDPRNYSTTDLYDKLVQRNPMQLTNSMSVSGGTEAIRYYINGSAASQKGLLEGYDYKRYTVQSNLDIRLATDFKLGLNLAYINSKTLSPKAGTDPFGAILLNPPYNPIYNQDGSLFALNEAGNRYANTVPELSGYTRNSSNNVSAAANFEYAPKFINGLTFRLNSSVNVNAGDFKAIEKSYIAYKPNPNGSGYIQTAGLGSNPTGNTIQLNSGTGNAYSTDFGFDYARTFGKHRFGLMALGTNYYRTAAQTQVRRIGLVSGFESLNQASSVSQTTNGSDTEEGRLGAVGRFSYDYAGKYSLEYSTRADASDNFPKAHRWGFFHGAAVAWRLSEENFIKDNLNFIQDFKIRASYGLAGVDINLDQFSYFNTYAVANTGYNQGNGYIIGGNYQPGIYLTNQYAANPNVTWGKSLMRNLGVDFTVLSGVLSGTFDIWDKNLYDLPYDMKIATPATFGIDPPKVNFSKEFYSGFETSLTNNLKIGKDMGLTTSVNFSYNHSRIIDRGEDENATPVDLRREGYSAQAKNFYKALGLFQTQQEIDNYPVKQEKVLNVWTNSRLKPGDIKFADLSGPDGTPDGIIDDYDKVMYNNAGMPPYTFGLNLTYRYKGLSLNAFFQGAGGNVVQFTPGNYTDYGYNNAWRPGNEDAKYPRLSSIGSNGNNNTSSRPNTLYMMKADYVRFKNLRLAYSIPAKYMKKTGLSNATISVAALNIWATSKIKDIDPEGLGSDVNSGAYYPVMRNYSVSLNIGF